MKSKKLKQLIAVAIVSATVSTMYPIPVAAEWLKDSQNNWNWIENGDKTIGWKQVEGTWYYFDIIGNMKTGWIKTPDSNWYYMNSDGSMKTGWMQDTDEKWYNMASDGAMKTGWMQEANGTWYFANSSGAMETGVVEVEGKTYVLAESGVMLSGTVTVGGKTYATDESGSIVGDKPSIEVKAFTNEGTPITSNVSSNSGTGTTTAGTNNTGNISGNAESSSSNSGSSSSSSSSSGSSSSNSSSGNGSSSSLSAINVTSAGNATTIVNGETLQMNASVVPANATNQTIVWSVSTLTGGTATIDPSTGLLTATGVGTVRVTATNAASGVIGTKDITVVQTLSEAKTAALLALTTAFGTYTDTDYTTEKWATLTGFKTAGNTAIDGATNLAGVTTAETAATNGMAGVTTILADAKVVAHGVLTATFGTYTASNYTTTNWATLTGFKSTGDTEIDAATDVAGVTIAQATAIDGMAGVKTIAQTLAEAKVAAHGNLTTALGTYTSSNYTSGNWTILTGFKTTGDTAIDAATNLAGVTTAETSATNGMAGVTTILADAKVVAHGVLTTTFGTYASINYTLTDWGILTGFKTAGDTAIDAATNLAGVTTAQTTAIDGMAGIKTIEQTLADAKAASHGNITTAFDTYTNTDYTTEKWATLTGFRTTGDTAIDAATDLAGVTTAETAATNGMAGVTTILADAKVVAHGALTTALGTYTSSNYTTTYWTTLTGFKSAGDTAIDAATNLAGVTTAQTTAIDGMAGIKTIAQILAEAKTAAHGNLATAFETYTDTDYTSTNWTKLEGFKTTGYTAIDAATDLAEVTTAETTATNKMAGVMTILKLEKTYAHDALALTLGGYKEIDYTKTDWGILTGMKSAGDTAIDAATNVAGVTTAQTTAIDGMAGIKTIAQILAEAKTAAHGNLATAFATYTNTDYTTEKWTTLAGFKTTGDTAIDAAIDVAGVTTAQTTATNGMAGVTTILADAKVVAHGVLTTAFGTYTASYYTSANLGTLTDFKSDGDTAIDAATDVAEVDTAKDTAVDGMAGIKTIAQTLADAKVAAHGNIKTAYETYREIDYKPTYWTALTGFKTAGDTAIDAATDVAGVTTAQITAINGMAGVTTILADAKVAAHEALAAAFGIYVSTNYTPTNWEILKDFRSTGDAEIDAATNLAGVTTVKDTATNGMASVETITQMANTEIGKVPAAQAAYLNINYGTSVSDEVYTDVTTAKNALDAAITLNVTANVIVKTTTLKNKLEVLSLETISLAAAYRNWGGVTVDVFETAGINGVTSSNLNNLEQLLNNKTPADQLNCRFTKLEIREEVDKL